jgi:NADPH:quinone reductase-like Zn-dependent oxidoreductase
MMDVEPASPTNPKIPGMDFSGTIHSVGSNVDKSRFAVGDEVFGLAMDITGKGTMQQYLAMAPAPAGDEQGSHVVIKKPDQLTPTQAAALPLVYSTIYTGFVHYGHLTYPSNATHNQASSATASKEKSVLILGGSGGTGSMAIQFAKQIPEVGGRIVTSCSGKNAEFVKSLGAAEVSEVENPSTVSCLSALYDRSSTTRSKTSSKRHSTVPTRHSISYSTASADQTSSHISTSCSSMIRKTRIVECT